jgi:hypothetical protein
MGKNIAAGVAGVVIAVALVWLVEKIGHAVYPPPADLDLTDAEAMRAYIATLPPGALLFVAAAWFVGTLCGTCAACAIGTAKPTHFAVVVGGLMLVATIMNLAMIPHPMWFSVLGIVGVLVGAWLGTMCERATAGNAA